MLTDFMVTCPHVGCNWSGSLLPCSNLEAWRGATPSTQVVLFRCPHCHGEWRAQLVGDDVKPVPLMDARMASV